MVRRLVPGGCIHDLFVVGGAVTVRFIFMGYCAVRPEGLGVHLQIGCVSAGVADDSSMSS